MTKSKYHDCLHHSFFEGFTEDIEHLIPEEWECTSWKNDACPSWTIGKFQIFINHQDHKKREIGGSDFRFSVIYEELYGFENSSIYYGDCIYELLFIMSKLDCRKLPMARIKE
jgi:hypothetical protein